MSDRNEGPDQGMTVRVADRMTARGSLRRARRMTGRMGDRTVRRMGDRLRRGTRMA